MTVSSSSASSSVHLYESAYFFLTFSEDLDFFLGDKLQASTVYTLQLLWRGRNDAKSQLCECSFQDSLRQKNWALEQIRKFPDTIGYMWTAVNDSNTLRVDAKIFATAKKYLRKKKFPDTCGHGLRTTAEIPPSRSLEGGASHHLPQTTKLPSTSQDAELIIDQDQPAAVTSQPAVQLRRSSRSRKPPAWHNDYT